MLFDRCDRCIRCVLGLILLLVISGCGLSPARSHLEATSASCPAGDAAFAATVFPLLRNNCALCHDGEGRGPARGPSFAGADPAQSARAVRGLVDFRELSSSVLVRVGGNHHCLNRGGPSDCGTSSAKLLSATEGWLLGGEASCSGTAGAFVSPSLPLPSSLPPAGKTFATLRWDLASVDQSLAGVRFEIQAQHFEQPTATTKGAYLFRRPRLGTATTALKIGGLHLVLNGHGDARDLVYQRLARRLSPQPFPAAEDQLWPFPALSSKSQIVLQEQASGDSLSVVFTGLTAVAANPSCKAVELFRPLLNVFAVRDCYSCHGGGPDQEVGTAAARERLPMAQTTEQLCEQALERADLEHPAASLFLSYALGSAFGHPAVSTSAEEWEPAWSGWLKAEQ